MANLVVCCDGTWSSPENDSAGEVAVPTNVYKLFCAVDTSSGEDEIQLTRYQAGVGTGGIVDQILGGAVGYGLGEDIRTATSGWPQNIPLVMIFTCLVLAVGALAPVAWRDLLVSSG